MSPLPSPLKSPVPTIDHAVGRLPTAKACETVEPFISHIATLPLVSRQSQSCLPSPLKSLCPTSDQIVGAAPTPADWASCVPFMSHSAALPPVSRQAMSLLPSPLKSWELTVVSAQRAIWLVASSTNHSAPSGPIVITAGLPPSGGAGNSAMPPPGVMRADGGVGGAAEPTPPARTPGML